jgi:hypothetical protein
MKNQDVAVESPCNANWSAMQRGDKSRFCGDCKKTVHDLTSMSKAEASALLAAPATEELCVRYLHDEMGHLVFVDTFRDRPIPLVALLRKRAGQAVAVAALGMSLTACMGAMRPPKVVPPTKPVPVEPAPAPVEGDTTAPTPTEPATAPTPATTTESAPPAMPKPR